MVVRWCYEQNKPVTVRGRGTATTGAAVPIHGGVVLSCERMKRIINVDPDNRVLVAEAGVTNQMVQDAAGEHGFFWAPDPTSRAVSTIGGNLACNAAGPRAVKFATPRENVLGLQAVNGEGELFRCGCYTTKGVVGYDLTRLLIGSEGTLAIITEAILKLTPLPECKRALRLCYASVEAAAMAVAKIMAQPVIPWSLELMDQRAIEMVRDYSGLSLPENAKALLIIEVDSTASGISAAIQAILNAAEHTDLLESIIAESKEAEEQLWITRKSLSPSLRKIAPKKINEDVVVPVAAVPNLISALQEIEKRHRITIATFGHAGNGNLHVNLLVNPDDPEEMQRAELALKEIFKITLELKGTLSGEHGVGLVKREYIRAELDPVSLKMMHQIKSVLDPLGILNPGKTLPEKCP